MPRQDETGARTVRRRPDPNRRSPDRGSPGRQRPDPWKQDGSHPDPPNQDRSRPHPPNQDRSHPDPREQDRSRPHPREQDRRLPDLGDRDPGHPDRPDGDRTDRGPRKPGRSGPNGFSLVEALLAALVLVLAAGGLVRAVSASSTAGRAAAHAGLAATLARARLDELHAAPLSQPWPLSGYHEAVAPGGSVDPAGPGSPGHVAFFGERGEPASPDTALYEVRWSIRELTSAGSDRLRSLRFEVLAMPTARGRGPVVRLVSVRVANRA